MKKKTYINIGIVLVLLGPLVVFSVFSYYQNQKILTDNTIHRREAVASLASLLIKERLDGAVDLASSLASRPTVRANVGSGNWKEAFTSIEKTPENFSFVESTEAHVRSKMRHLVSGVQPGELIDYLAVLERIIKNGTRA